GPCRALVRKHRLSLKRHEPSVSMIAAGTSPYASRRFPWTPREARPRGRLTAREAKRPNSSRDSASESAAGETEPSLRDGSSTRRAYQVDSGASAGAAERRTVLAEIAACWK